MSREQRGTEGGWPAWLEPLRPDPMSRARMRRSILTSAAPLLAARHPLAWWEVAADWSSVAVPIAASIALLFGWIAYTSGTSAAATPEPTLLVDRSEPSSDALRDAALRQGGR
jgi:hypothetical protein